MKIIDGNGTEVFTRHGWNSTSYNTSSSLQEISFEDSKNITIQVSLINQWSYVKISYGTLKKPLHLGRKTTFAACEVRPCPLHKLNYISAVYACSKGYLCSSIIWKCSLCLSFFCNHVAMETREKKSKMGFSLLLTLDQYQQ